MLTPHWILDTFAAVMLAVAVLSAARLAIGRPGRRGAVAVGIDIAHLVMSVAMAGTLTANLVVSGPLWPACFAVLTGSFAVVVAIDVRASGARAITAGHGMPHLVHSAAMLYMALALRRPAAGAAVGMGATSGSGLGALSMPTLALVFAVALIGYGVRDLDQVSGRRYRLAVAVDGVADHLTGIAVTPRTGAAPAADAFAPEITVGCRIAMGVTMALMLLIMI